MELMARYPDNYFDLAIVDPPYGINHANKAGEQSGQKYGNASTKKRNYTKKDWDLNIPNQLYFDELKRVSKNQIVWGGNYMTLKNQLHFINGCLIDTQSKAIKY
jgi:site-specific DNA-methyltransferase (adenine-specific)